MTTAITPPPCTDVAEIQGLYGSFSFPERLLQKIWLKRDFNLGKARTVDGVSVTILHPGRWNQLGGPDFKGAKLRFGEGPEVIGDVELHLRAQDWDAHAHARDSAYDGVVLHVVLFWPSPRHVTRGGQGQVIPVLPLLPLLHHDLEEYAGDEAVESLSNRPTARLTNELAVYPATELRTLLRRHAAARWRQKVHFAWLRIQKLGWEGACHHAALEVLGFRYNRGPMLRIATRWSLDAWRRGQIDTEEALRSQGDTWSVQGVRPANHPRTRLRQYAAWTATCPDWPDRLVRWSGEMARLDADGDTRWLRRKHSFTSVRTRLATQICGGALGGARLDTMVCDAFLPLWAGRAESQDGYAWWFHWFGGDMPSFVNSGLRQLGVWDGTAYPACHGFVQGLLGWLIEREVRR